MDCCVVSDGLASEEASSRRVLESWSGALLHVPFFTGSETIAHARRRRQQMLTSARAAFPMNPPFHPGACLSHRNPTPPAQTLRLGTTLAHHPWNRWATEAAASSPYTKDLPTHLRSIDTLQPPMLPHHGLIATRMGDKWQARSSAVTLTSPPIISAKYRQVAHLQAAWAFQGRARTDDRQ
jgi:hypothetical protein